MLEPHALLDEENVQVSSSKSCTPHSEPHIILEKNVQVSSSTSYTPHSEPFIILEENVQVPQEIKHGSCILSNLVGTWIVLPLGLRIYCILGLILVKLCYIERIMSVLHNMDIARFIIKKMFS